MEKQLYMFPAMQKTALYTKFLKNDKNYSCQAAVRMNDKMTERQDRMANTILYCRIILSEVEHMCQKVQLEPKKYVFWNLGHLETGEAL